MVWWALLTLPTAMAQSGGDYVITRSTIDSGGHSNLAGGDYRLGGTVGQHDAANVSGGDYSLRGGFWATPSACPASSTPEPAEMADDAKVISRNRVLSFKAGDPGRTQLIRVTAQQLPAPFDVWDCSGGNCTQWWVGGPPRRICEGGGTADAPSPAAPPNYGCPTAGGLDKGRRWNWYFPLVCKGQGGTEPLSQDWHGVCAGGACVGGLNPGQTCTVDANCQDTINVYHEAIIPSRGSTATAANQAIYDVQVIDGTCDQGSAASYSAALTIINPRYGDTVRTNSSGDCPRNASTLVSTAPHNVTGLPDVASMLDKFSGVSCAIKKARGDLRPQVINFKVDSADITAVLDAFAGANYPSGPLSPANPCGLGTAETRLSSAHALPAEQLPTSYSAVLRVVPRQAVIAPGALVNVDVYVDGVVDLRSYQITLSASGGTRGTLVLEGGQTDRGRADHVFGTADAVDAVDLVGGRLAAALFAGGTSAATQAYLATFALRASSDASGTFEVKIETADEASLLLSSEDQLMQFSSVPVTIAVGRRPGLLRPTQK